MPNPDGQQKSRATEQSPLDAAAQRFASTRNRPALIYFLPNEPIGTRNVRQVGEKIGEREFNELDLVVQSSGGDIHAAFQLISFLRFRTDRLITCVPRFARSAASLLCVGADVIVLDELSALGPLDAQVWDGNTDGTPRYTSALNAFKGLERLRDFSLDSLGNAASRLYRSGITRTDETMRYATEFVRVTASPLFEKFQSHRLGEYSQALAIGEEYGRRLLERKEKTLTKDQREDIVRRLVHHYPSHEYVIDYRELRRLNLDVQQFTPEERAVARELAKHESQRMIALVEPVAAPGGVHPPPTTAEQPKEDPEPAVPPTDGAAIRHEQRDAVSEGQRPPNPWERW